MIRLALQQLKASHEAALLNFRQIASQEDIPEEYLAKILRHLVVSGLIYSVRGAKGGYGLAKEPSEISFLDVIEAVEGPVIINVCLGENQSCPVQLRCSMYSVWHKAQDAMLDVFRKTRLSDVLPGPISLHDLRIDAGSLEVDSL